MLALAGQPLGQQFRFLERGAASKTGQQGPVCSLGDDGIEGLQDFVHGLDVITFENENFEPATLERAARSAPVHPSPRALVLSQDRLTQKELFQRLGVPSSPFAGVDGAAGLDRAIAQVGLPAVLKLRRGGYDGRGQWVLRDAKSVAVAQRELGGRAAILERFVPFERELSIIAVRGRDGSRAFYPLAWNHHENGCLRLSLAPAPRCGEELARAAEAMANALLDELDYVGVLALELFEFEGKLLANELAPRVHNSGHWTIEGAQTSQFENHLRAISGLPLGSTRAIGACAMLNLLGRLPATEQVLAVPGAHIHLYGKEPAAGRKLGHVTLRARDEDELAANLRELCGRLSFPIPSAVERWMHSSSCASI